ncbi:epidermal growth factor-like protein 7 isoform X1 [Sus scrofa]|uniref:epidermal growth factor-like protein 7 isoform X1 n=1 Tax=Sus scrofa TaxID=9823 RepID=UPI000A2B7094|nr:epidermal growth factor-like protein 7 isoform X1 [Sus scrofa]XP_020936698.1 epidermal growth factor-like protein 7 isoform X1 [Sus scrofa]XP_020936699.1 epidermal growth factor-like protein 7 isoform X1 [Sus scrofa]
MGTGPAAPTGPSTGLPTAAALGQPPPGPAMPAARAGRGPAGSLGPVEQQYATRHARTEGAVSGQAAVTALQGGGATPARQMWMNAVLEGAAVPSTVSTPQAVTGVTVRRGTAHLWTGHSACPGEGPPGWPQTPQQPSTESTARTSAGTTLGSAGTGDPDLTERGPGGCVCPEPPPSPQVGPGGRPGPRMGERGSPRQGGCAPHPERWLRTGYEASLRGVQRGSRAPLTRPLALPGADSAVKEEVQRLQSRVDVLEQKLQLVLAPLHSLASRALEHGLPDPGSLLAHSLQQLDRIDSLSEQISLLEEQLGSCSCKKEL